MLERLKKKPNKSVLSLIFFILCHGGSYAAGEILSACLKVTMPPALIIIWAVFFAVFLAAFRPVFVSIGKRPGRTLFAMSGGIFTIVFGIIVLLNEATRREHWHEMTGWRKIIDLMGFSYFWFIPLPLIIAIAVGISSYHKKAAETEN